MAVTSLGHPRSPNESEMKDGAPAKVSAHSADGTGKLGQSHASLACQQDVVDFAQWQARAEAHIVASMQARMPDMVKLRVMWLVTPLQSNILSLEAGQKSMGETVGHLRPEVQGLHGHS